MKRIFAASAAALLITAAPGAIAQVQVASPIPPQLTAADPESRLSIDYQVWSDLLRDIVLNVGPSDREPQRRREQLTGTRINTANQTRYRYEGNRVVYHLMSEEYQQAITQYREELEAIPSQIDFSSLSRNEQLAYWFNLHNVAVIEQIMLQYPETRINRMNAAGTRDDLFDAQILNVAGAPLSLNDIRQRIVYENWDDPRVIYGFFNGSIGGPNIRREAYNGDDVWNQLNSNAREFINSLRGVEIARSRQRVSHLYEEAGRFFPDFERDLRRHLAVYADDVTASELSENAPIHADIEEWSIADMINGSRRCTGGAGDLNVTQSSPREYSDRTLGADSYVAPDVSCAIMPTNARLLMDHVIERRIELYRQGRLGEVRTIDIPTDEQGNPIRLQPYTPEEVLEQEEQGQ